MNITQSTETRTAANPEAASDKTYFYFVAYVRQPFPNALAHSNVEISRPAPITEFADVQAIQETLAKLHGDAAVLVQHWQLLRVEDSPFVFQPAPEAYPAT